jgi:RNA recognition motif-containing protein
VFAYNLSTKAGERDIFEFFSQAGGVRPRRSGRPREHGTQHLLHLTRDSVHIERVGAGGVRTRSCSLATGAEVLGRPCVMQVLDVRIIYDRNTPKSKGMAYIEMAQQTDIPACLSLTGQMLKGQVVMVKASEAEKNVAWCVPTSHRSTSLPPFAHSQRCSLSRSPGEGGGATLHASAGRCYTHTLRPAWLTSGGLPWMPAREVAQQQKANPGAAVFGMNGLVGQTAGPCKLAVSGVHPNVLEADLMDIFKPFGEVDFLLLSKDDPAATTHHGHGFVQYKTTAAGMQAIQQLNNLELAGNKLQVTTCPPPVWSTASSPYGLTPHPQRSVCYVVMSQPALPRAQCAS